MNVTLIVTSEQERVLEEIAEANGLSVEGYLLTFIEAITTSGSSAQKKGLLAKTGLFQGRRRAQSEMRVLADDAARQMRAEVLAHKERAVEAVTKTNLLQKTVEHQERLVAERELRALNFVRDGERERALHCYQESCIYTENLEHTRAQLQEAAHAADELLAVFKREEAKMRARVSRAQAAALEAIKHQHTKTVLSAEQMQQRIQQTAAPEQWQEMFDAWVQSTIKQEHEIPDGITSV